MTVPAVRIPTETWVLPRPRSDAYVGGFPLHFERRPWATLGKPEKVLHPFGGLAEIGDSVDLNETTAPTWVGDAHDLHWIADETYDLVILGPALLGRRERRAVRNAAAALVRVHERGGPRLQGPAATSRFTSTCSRRVRRGRGWSAASSC